MLTTPIPARERRGEQKADPERDRNRPYGVGARGTDKDRNARPEIARRAAPHDLGVDRARRPGDRPSEHKTGREKGGQGSGHVPAS